MIGEKLGQKGGEADALRRAVSIGDSGSRNWIVGGGTRVLNSEGREPAALEELGKNRSHSSPARRVLASAKR